MHIEDHKLFVRPGKPARLAPTPNLSAGRPEYRYLVIHYTAARNLESAVSWLTSPGAGASAHLVIGRGGEVVQLAPFDRVAMHAGRSRWRGIEGLNRHSIGIELDNAGRLQRVRNRWQTWFGAVIDDRSVLEAPHKDGSGPFGWQTYTAVQVEVATEVARLLVAHYGLRDVVGHEDIAPGRKQDPGPAFPMASLASRALGRREGELEIFETIAHLNIRSGPGLGAAKLPNCPLPPGAALRVLGTEGRWCAVETIGPDGLPDRQGWVHGDYIRPVDA
jgi:N-acetylmuramoyl-L-alanine amidase